MAGSSKDDNGKEGDVTAEEASGGSGVKDLHTGSAVREPADTKTRTGRTDEEAVLLDGEVQQQHSGHALEQSTTVSSAEPESEGARPSSTSGFTPGSSSSSSSSTATTPPSSDDIQSSSSSSSSASSSSPSSPVRRPLLPPEYQKSIEQRRQLALTKLSSLKLKTLKELAKRQEELNKRFGEAGARISTVTGYGEIENLKSEVVRNEIELMEARQAAREAKEAHASALNERMASGREVNDLLQRKANWLASDVVRFTELVQTDHANEVKEKDLKIDVNRREERVEKKIDDLMRSILRRYHEEQIWSDKIRSLSTYGSLAITSINVLIFLLALIFVEPYKRKRMVNEVEARIKQHDLESGEKVHHEIEGLKSLLIAATFSRTEELPSSSSEAMSDFAPPSENPRETTEPVDIDESLPMSDSTGHAMVAIPPEVPFPGDDEAEAELLEAAAASHAAEEQAEEYSASSEPSSEAMLVAQGSPEPPPSLTSPRQREEKYKRDLIYVGAAGAVVGSALATLLSALFG